MARSRQRSLNIFTMSFLDVMSCGFGAVILFFMIISAQIAVETQEYVKEDRAEIERLEARVASSERQLIDVQDSLSSALTRRASTRSEAQELNSAVQEARQRFSVREQVALERREQLRQLQEELERLEQETTRLMAEALTREEAGRQIRSVRGEAQRAYLTGLRMGGERVMILVDVSTSMLDETIVNVIRRRNMPFERKVQSPKWQRVLSTVDWITAQIPRDSQFQVYLFNSRAWPLVEGTEQQWLAASEAAGRVDDALEQLRQAEPNEGSSLHAAFTAIRQMSPPPDNVFLITDSLPTLGDGPARRSTVSGRERVRHFQEAFRVLPTNVPMNVVLFPLEGDPRAAPMYWELTLRTGGTFLSPTRDWP